jgi:hypothetical protein
MQWLIDPPAGAFSVTPADSDFTGSPSYYARSIYVGGTGDLKVRTFNGEDVVFKSVPQGTTISLIIKRVWSTGTGATLLVATYMALLAVTLR